MVRSGPSLGADHPASPRGLLWECCSVGWISSLRLVWSSWLTDLQVGVYFIVGPREVGSPCGGGGSVLWHRLVFPDPAYGGRRKRMRNVVKVFAQRTSRVLGQSPPLRSPSTTQFDCVDLLADTLLSLHFAKRRSELESDALLQWSQSAINRLNKFQKVLDHSIAIIYTSVRYDFHSFNCRFRGEGVLC